MRKNIILQNSNNINPINQTKFLISVTNRLLGDHAVASIDNDWMRRLWQWADENGIETTDEFDIFCISNDEKRLDLTNKNKKMLWEKIETIDYLSDRERNVIYMRYWLEYSYAQIGAKLMVTDVRAMHIHSSAKMKLQNAAKNKLPRAKKELLECRSLFLFQLDLNALPKELFCLKNLESLTLFLPLKELHPDIAKLTNLKSLYIISPKLKELPDSIENMSSLELITVWDSELEKLPNNIADMKSLRSIWIMDSQIQELPQNIFDNKTLWDINIRGKLTELPEANNWKFRDREDWEHLSINLDFSDNNLKSLPASFAYLQNADLNIRDNPLEMTNELLKLIEIMELNGCMVEI